MSCPESALLAMDRAGTVKEDAREGWKVWENLPDTPGNVIEKVEADLELGQLAARFLSRHSSQVQAVGSFGEPGSGERLACRIVSGIVESQLQKRLADQAAEASKLAGQLRDQVQGQLAKGLTEADPKAIQSALESLPRHRVSLSDLSERLSSFGKAVSLDPVKTLRLAQTAHDLETEAWQLTEGPNRLGRSRFSVVIVSHRIARWAGRFPNHPYNAPLVVEPSPEGAGLAVGLAEAAALKHVDRVRTYRRANLYLENPSDLPGRLVDLENLTWSDLTAEERATCPPLLVFADESALRRQGLGALGSLLSSKIPVKLILLDTRFVNLATPEPALFGLGFPGAFVLSGSLGALVHLENNLEEAIKFSGPAVIHIHVPIPQEQGFEPSKTIERARLAVQARVQPLFVFNPAAEGAFGLRVSVEGNPGIDSPWGGCDPIQWAFEEERFKPFFVPLSEDVPSTDWREYVGLAEEDRRDTVPSYEDAGGNTWKIDRRLAAFAERRSSIWEIYQEIGGIASPHLDRLRSEVEQEVTDQSRAEFEETKAGYEARISQLEQESDTRLAGQLRERLLVLAGFGSKTHTDDTNE